MRKESNPAVFSRNSLQSAEPSTASRTGTSWPVSGVVVGVGEESDVEESVYIEGGAVLEAEGDEADGHPAGEGFRKLLEPQAGVERRVARGIDHHIGHLPQVCQMPPLTAYCLEDVAVAGGRVWPAALLVAPDERGVVGVDEQDAVLPALLHGLQVPLQFLAEVPASAHVHHDDHPVRTAVALRCSLHDGRDHTRWEVVYAEVSGIFESLEGVALARAREPCDNDDPALARGLGAGGLLTHVASSVPPGMHKPSRKARLAPRVEACNRF